MVDEGRTPVPEEEEMDEGEPEDELTAEAEDKKDTPAPKQLANELKVVIVMKADKLLLGVQSPDCDPVYTTMKGTLGAALKKVPKLVAEAKEKWGSNPLYPKANLPEPAPSPVPARTSSTKQTTAKTKEQPSMF